VGEGINIPLDGDDTQIRAKLKRVKAEAAQAGKAFGNASSQAARVGGAGGGMLARGIGGFQQGGAAGAIGLGLTAAGVALNAFLARDAERVSMAKAREVRSQERDAQARTVMERRDALAAGGKSFMGAARRMIARDSDPGLMRSRVEMGAKYGMSMSETLMAYDEALASGGSVTTGNIAVGMATGLIGDTPAAVAANIRKFNGVQNAIAAVANMSQDEAASAISNVENNPRAANIARAGAAMNPVEEAQMAALMSGETASVLGRQASDQLNPGARLASQAAQKAMDTVNQLRAAAEAQSTMAALLAEMGRVVGVSEGSAGRQLAAGAQAAAE